MGFPDEETLKVLALRIHLGDGSIRDELTGKPFKDDSRRKRTIHKALMYVLSAYAEAEPREPTGQLMSARQIRGGQFYSGSNTTTKAKLEEVFGREPVSGRLMDTARLLGGKATPLGSWDYSASIDVLPLVPCVVTVNAEDEEFPAEGRIFFDESVEAFFDMEQVNFLTILTVERLVDAYRALI